MEFTRDWAICAYGARHQPAGPDHPGRLAVAGTVGAALALVGLLLPSVAITLLLTAAYAQLQQTTLVQAALRGVVPATVGLGLLLAVEHGAAAAGARAAPRAAAAWCELALLAAASPPLRCGARRWWWCCGAAGLSRRTGSRVARGASRQP